MECSLSNSLGAHRSVSQRQVYAALYAGALLLSLLFCEGLALYWAHFHLGTAGGNGMALVFIALPGSTLVGGVAGTLVVRRDLRRGASPRLALWRGWGVIVVVLAVMLAYEVWRTRDLRTAQDESACLRVRDRVAAV